MHVSFHDHELALATRGPGWALKGVLALLATTAMAFPAAAQDEQVVSDQQETETAGAEDEDDALIVVTARHRAENLQEVPVSITAISGQRLEELGAGDFREIDGYVPNMVQVGLESNISPTISIRGISSDSRNTGFESGVSVYVDGVYTGRPHSWMAELADVASLEVLRGPQGTLFGKNTIAGAVNITSRKPGDEVAANIEIEVGDYNLVRSRASIYGPLVREKVSASLTAFITRRDGFQNNLATGQDFGNKNDHGGRAQLRFRPSDALEIIVSGDVMKERLRLPVNTLVLPVGGPFGIPAIAGPRDININERAYADRHIRGAAVTVNYELPNGGVLTSITAHRWNDIEFLTDEDLTAAAVFPRLYTHFNDEEKQFTQEVRYASPSDKRLRYVLGAFYYDQEVDSNRESISPPGGFGGLNPRTAIGPRLKALTETRDIAVFGQANFDITAQLELTVGARYTDTSKDLDFELQGLPAFGIISVPRRQYEQSNNAFSPMGSLLFRATDDVNVYATVSRGFKGGGFNADFVSNADLDFDPEYATTYEIGLKTFLLDKRLRFNLAAFRTDYTDLQVSSLSPLGGFIIENAGSAKIEGGEVEVEARPWTGFTLIAGLGHTNARFDEYEPNPAFNGNRLLNSPRWTASVTAAQKIQLGGHGSITLQGEYNYRSNYYVQLANTPNDLVKGYDLINARVTYTTPDGGMDLQGWVENLTNSLYIVDRGRPIGGAFGQRSVVYGKPLMYGFRLLARF